MMALSIALHRTKYAVLAMVFSAAMALAYPVIQVAPQGMRHFWFWFTLLGPAGWALYLAYVLLFGVSFAFLVWRLDEKTCSPTRVWGSGVISAVASCVAGIVPVCPSCLAFLFLFVPVNTLQFFVAYRTWVMSGALAVMLYGLWTLGAFDRVRNTS